MARGGSFLDKLLFGYRTIQWNGNILPPETTVNFIGSGPVVDNPSMGRTDVTMGGSSSGSAISLVENAGAPLPFEPILNFIGFTLADDAAHTRTNISAGPTGTWTVPQGGTGQASLNPNAVLLGEGTSPIGFVNPVSTGFVLTDQGPGHDPIFAPVAALPSGTGFVATSSGSGYNIAIPLPIIDGGTQRPSLTSHAVLIGEGTSPVNFAVATSAGYVLTDNGPGVDPTFQPAPGTSFPNPTSTDTSLTNDPVLFSSAPHLGWVSKRTVFNVRSYGAVGGNAGLDNAAWAAVISAINAAGGGTLQIPIMPSGQPLLVTSEQTTTVPIHLDADPGSAIRVNAGANLRSVLRLQAQSCIEGLQFFHQNDSQFGIIVNGAAGTTIERCYFDSQSVRAVGIFAYRSAASISLVSHTGGGPALTLTQPNPLLLMLGGDLYVKITTGGAVGTATFDISGDGITYSTVNQTLFATSPIGQRFPPQLATDTGLTLVASGTYVLNDVYHYSVTPAAGPFLNTNVRIVSCTGNFGGTIRATSGVFSEFPGGPVVSIAGTATWTAGSSIVNFSGAPDLTTLNLYDGDGIYLPGAKFACFDPSNPTRDMGTIALVTGPAQIYLDGGDLPSAPGSVSDFAILGGGVAYSSVITGQWNDGLRVIGGQFTQQANGIRDASLNPADDTAMIQYWGFRTYSGDLSSD